jgi:hypothetical protein
LFDTVVTGDIAVVTVVYGSVRGTVVTGTEVCGTVVSTTVAEGEVAEGGVGVHV